MATDCLIVSVFLLHCELYLLNALSFDAPNVGQIKANGTQHVRRAEAGGAQRVESVCADGAQHLRQAEASGAQLEAS